MAPGVATLRLQVSRDVLGRWAFPFTPDTNLLHAEPSAPWATGSTYHYLRGNVYRCHGQAISLWQGLLLGS